jgi:hypothetical protein
MYKFTSDGRSYSAGLKWRAGDTVPPDFPMLGAYIAAGIIKEVQHQSYEDMTFEELADLLRERELKISGNKQEKIDRLIDDDKGDKCSEKENYTERPMAQTEPLVR